MRTDPTLFLMVGLPGTGKTTEARLIAIALRALELGVNVVVDFGLWDRDERSALRHAATAVGARVKVRYLELTVEEQRRRLDRRQAEEPQATWHMSDEELAMWAEKFSVPTPGEIDGSEPVDDPPATYATWDEWRQQRWPPAL